MVQRRILGSLGSALLLSVLAGCTASPVTPTEPPILPPEVETPAEDPPVTNVNKTPAPSPVKVAARAAVPTTCIVLDDNRVRYVPFDGGEAVDGPSLPFATYDNNASLGLRDGWLYTCHGTVTRISLASGDAEMTDVPCESVTADEKGIWTMSGYDQSLVKYADHASLVAHQPAGRYPAPFASRVATSSEGLLTAWHSTNEAMLGDAGATPSKLTLQGYDGWIMGLDKLDDGRIVIATGLGDSSLRVHGADGSFLRSIPLSASPLVSGIVCVDSSKLGAATDGAVAVVRPPSKVFAENCTGGGTSSNYTDVANGATELHVVGVYEGQTQGPPCAGAQCGHPEGTVKVHVKKTDKPAVLVLSAYEPVKWVIDADPDAQIAKIVTQGYHAQSVTGAPEGTVVTTRSGTSAFGWEPQHSGGGTNFPLYMADIRVRDGRETSFQGCYAGNRFEIPYAQ